MKAAQGKVAHPHAVEDRAIGLGQLLGQTDSGDAEASGAAGAAGAGLRAPTCVRGAVSWRTQIEAPVLILTDRGVSAGLESGELGKKSASIDVTDETAFAG